MSINTVALSLLHLFKDTPAWTSRSGRTANESMNWQEQGILSVGHVLRGWTRKDEVWLNPEWSKHEAKSGEKIAS